MRKLLFVFVNLYICLNISFLFSDYDPTKCNITKWCSKNEDRRNFIYHYIPKEGIGCEIGVAKGIFSMFLLENTHPAKLYLIDPWSAFKKEKICNMESYFKNQQEWDFVYKTVCDKFNKYPHVTILRERSEVAAEYFDDETFDWIYIDGDHSYEGALIDLIKFFPKLKDGGVMLMDDYTETGVRLAFIDFRKICKHIGTVKVEQSQLIFFKKKRN